jgi:hypothetical protein
MWIIGGINCKLNISANPNLYLKIFKSMNQGTKWILLVDERSNVFCRRCAFNLSFIYPLVILSSGIYLEFFVFLFFVCINYLHPFFEGGGGTREIFLVSFYLLMSNTENDDDTKMALFTLCVCRDTSTSYARWSRTSPWVPTPRARRSGMSSETFQ